MTTKNEVVDSLTTQGKGTSQEEAPPQTIIGTFPTLDSVVQAAIMARDKVGVGLSNAIVKKYGRKIADLPQDKWQEAGEWFDSMVTNGENIIMPVVPTETQFARKIEEAHGIGGPKIIPPSDEQLASRKTAEEVFNKSFTQLAFEAEQRRQTVQAEAMVNLAVGVVLTQVLGVRNVTITQEDLFNFNRAYSATQHKNDDGSFTIIVTPKEVDRA